MYQELTPAQRRVATEQSHRAHDEEHNIAHALTEQANTEKWLVRGAESVEEALYYRRGGR